MKQFKIDILKKIENEAQNCKIISLREQANTCGINHLKTQECLEIANAFLKNHSDYKMVRIMNTENDSIFTSLNFVEKSLEFDN